MKDGGCGGQHNGNRLLNGFTAHAQQSQTIAQWRLTSLCFQSSFNHVG